MKRFLQLIGVASWAGPGLALLLLHPAVASAQDGLYTSADGTLRMDAGYSDVLLDRQDNVTNKVARILHARASGQVPDGSLTFGGRLVATQIFERTNTAGNFPILSRLPPTHTQGKSDSYGVINEISLNATVALPWVTGLVQGEYTEVAYPGQDDIQLRKYMIIVGNLNRSPLYLAFGRKTLTFGDFSSYAPFTHTHSSHYFWAQSDDPVFEVGYVTDRTEIALTLIPEHRGNRVISSPNNDGDLSNFAVNAAHRFDLGPRHTLKAGAGYLRGTIYDSIIAHHPPGTGINRSWNGAFDANLTLSGPRFDVQAEFTRSIDDWPATGHHVQATTLQARWHRRIAGNPVTYSISASRGVQGADGTEWERMQQVILGVEYAPAPHVTLGAEYMYNSGFVPLIMPRITSDRSVESHTVIAGLKLTF